MMVTTKTTRQALGLLGATVSVGLLSGCHVDMWRQPKVLPYSESEFYSDHQGSRPLIDGTVARGKEDIVDTFHTGKEAGKPIKSIPPQAVKAFGTARAMLDRGEERYNIYCQPCHGRLGDGNGFIAQRGLGFWQKLPATLHIDRLRKETDGYIYDVVVNGKGAMYGYGSRIQDANDRWAVVAYVRTLQAAYLMTPVEPMPKKNDEKKEEMSVSSGTTGGAGHE